MLSSSADMDGCRLRRQRGGNEDRSVPRSAKEQLGARSRIAPFAKLPGLSLKRYTPYPPCTSHPSSPWPLLRFLGSSCSHQRACQAPPKSSTRSASRATRTTAATRPASTTSAAAASASACRRSAPSRRCLRILRLLAGLPTKVKRQRSDTPATLCTSVWLGSPSTLRPSSATIVICVWTGWNAQTFTEGGAAVCRTKPVRVSFARTGVSDKGANKARRSVAEG